MRENESIEPAEGVFGVKSLTESLLDRGSALVGVVLFNLSLVDTAVILYELVSEAHVKLVGIAAVSHLAELILHEKLVSVSVDPNQLISKICPFIIDDFLGSQSITFVCVLLGIVNASFNVLGSVAEFDVHPAPEQVIISRKSVVEISDGLRQIHNAQAFKRDITKRKVLKHAKLFESFSVGLVDL